MKAVKKNTLKWINGIRDDYDLDPLDDLEHGTSGVATCPVAQSIKKDNNLKNNDFRVYVQKGQTCVIKEGLSTCYPSTKYVEEFIHRFDTQQKYVEYNDDPRR